MPVDSVEAAQAWRVERQNIAQRKPVPKPVDTAGFFPKTLPPADMAPWPGDGEAGGGRGSGAISSESFEEARIRHKVAEANLAELEEARIKGLHVEKTRVDLAFFEAARGLRDGMTNCSRRLAAEVATLSTPSECEVIIARELRHLLESFTKQLVQKAGMPVVEDGGT